MMMIKSKGKERQRYLLVHYVLEKKQLEDSSSDKTPITEKTLWKTIGRTHSALHGDLRSSYSGLYIMTHDPRHQLFLLRTALRSLDEVLITLTMITKLEGRPCAMWPLKITGTVKKGKKLMQELSSQASTINQVLREFFSKASDDAPRVTT